MLVQSVPKLCLVHTMLKSTSRYTLENVHIVVRIADTLVTPILVYIVIWNVNIAKCLKINIRNWLGTTYKSLDYGLLNIEISRLSNCNFRWLNPSKLEKDNTHVPSVPKLRKYLRKSGLILLFTPVKGTFPVISVPILLVLKAVLWDTWENYIWNKCFVFLDFC